MLSSSIRLSSGIRCLRCNDRLVAPNGSTYVREHHIRHSWLCDRCGQYFETSDRLAFHESSQARGRLPSFSLLVA
jgi:transcription elongation factor Elf1